MRWIRSELVEDWAVRVLSLMRNDLGENWVGPDLSRNRTRIWMRTVWNQV
jgi:hypothetical protein